MSQADREFATQQAAIANAEYEELKAKARADGWPHSVTTAKISKRHGKHPKWLKYYRTNHLTFSGQNKHKHDRRANHNVLPRRVPRTAVRDSLRALG